MAEPRYIVDAGLIIAALNRRDEFHVWAKSVFASLGEPPVTCEAVLTAVCWHLLAIRRGRHPKGSGRVLLVLN